ncbi:hypothetical protein Geob_3794 [Geotalea daltonii FRC-32]|uniref:DUF1565 domain-containing protein n=1 Tax=Geotalea daltonii (strain DSM 22248 / JCM 15807 / FRC-32) TaxID=316067 RepID=B9M7M6_GEODF|nr:hypothetical protein [Geotalea daltonii]ACM22132.1 hypothetical protein Geob_3794 [Geotalea daltonii FRC-32]
MQKKLIAVLAAAMFMTIPTLGMAVTNVVVVAKDGGDFTDPVAALNSIYYASATNPYVLKIMPGVYDIGDNYLRLRPYIEIEGSGEKVTTITGNAGAGNCVVNAANNSGIRNITIQSTAYAGAASCTLLSLASNFAISNATLVSTGAASYHRTISAGGASASMSLTHATIISDGGGGSESMSIYNEGSKVTIVDSSIQSSSSSAASGIVNAYGATVDITNTKIVANDGVATGSGVSSWDAGSSITIKGSTISGTSNKGIDSTGNVTIAHSQVTGPISTSGAKCIGVYNTNLAPVICP